MKDRIKEIRKQCGETQQEFADRLGVSKNNIVNYELGRRNPSTAVIQLICSKYRVNEEWLMYGDGIPYKEESREEEIAKFLGVVANAPEESSMKRFAHLLARLPEDWWDVIDQKLLEIEKEKKERNKE